MSLPPFYLVYANLLTRRAYTRRDYVFLAQHYRHRPAAALAHALGRTPGSLYRFIARYPSYASRAAPEHRLGISCLPQPGG
ncbi:hypothetical protein [Hymenobacter sp. BRD67]|uniref:hypothetical protein n=1 Tax=Hymenobacter sp. BRD67 TaxID=2675877 RepID=UPI0015659691|nr:hypothetical protein [Hymenobacter sp. BRD67]QKG54487.1 hypothetical protein GKZ67_20130 [Hymenobacter sp. BRD67]